jgi:hypothetical protein
MVISHVANSGSKAFLCKNSDTSLVILQYCGIVGFERLRAQHATTCLFMTLHAFAVLMLCICVGMKTIGSSKSSE